MFPQPQGMTEQLLSKLPGFVLRSQIKQSEQSHFVNVFVPGDYKQGEQLPVMVSLTLYLCFMTLERRLTSLQRGSGSKIGFHLVRRNSLYLSLPTPPSSITVSPDSLDSPSLAAEH